MHATTAASPVLRQNEAPASDSLKFICFGSSWRSMASRGQCRRVTHIQRLIRNAHTLQMPKRHMPDEHAVEGVDYTEWSSSDEDADSDIQAAIGLDQVTRTV